MPKHAQVLGLPHSPPVISSLRSLNKKFYSVIVRRTSDLNCSLKADMEAKATQATMNSTSQACIEGDPTQSRE